MEMRSRTENSLRNIRVTLLFQASSFGIAFFTRKIFVQMLTQEYLGLDGTFSNILSMLSLTELGIGSAITYSLYKPLAEKDQGQIVALMALFRRVYWTIGGIVALFGCALTPFLPVLVRDLPDIPHIDWIYLFFVLNSSLSYFYAYKQSLMIADQRQYITTACHFILSSLLRLAQMAFLWLSGDYFIYLGLQIGTTMLENLIHSQITDLLYPYIRRDRHVSVAPETKREIIKNTKALMLHRAGGIVVFGTDNLLISIFVGVVEVGVYSNYLMVINALGSLSYRVFYSLTASVGNLKVSSEAKHILSVFQRANFAGNWLYGFSTVCLTVLLGPFIELWLGRDYLFSRGTVCLILMNFYVTGMRQVTLIFRDACGLYQYEGYKPVWESAINLVVSAILAVPFGVTGIFAGTFISTMTTCFWVEPVVLFRYGLHADVGIYFKDYIYHTLVTLLTTAAVWQICVQLPGAGLPLFLTKMAVCAVLGNLGYLLAYCRREELRFFVALFIRITASIRRGNTR